MSRARRMQRIVALADAATRRASMQLANSRRALEQNQQQLEQFRGYQREYMASMHTAGTSISAAEARELRRFVAQLEQTISALQTRAERAETQHRQDVARWHKEHRRADALNRILTREQRAELHVEQAREQREADDRVRLESE